MKSQPIEKQQVKKDVEITNTNRKSHTKTGIPIRTVIFVEVGTMGQNQIAELLRQLNDAYDNNNGSVHYVIPIRNGRIPSDVLFENEIEDFVNKICEVNDGKIKLKNGANECVIIRETI